MSIPLPPTSSTRPTNGETNDAPHFARRAWLAEKMSVALVRSSADRARRHHPFSVIST
jgi:hypothetical protein